MSESWCILFKPNDTTMKTQYQYVAPPLSTPVGSNCFRNKCYPYSGIRFKHRQNPYENHALVYILSIATPAWAHDLHTEVLASSVRAGTSQGPH